MASAKVAHSIESFEDDIHKLVDILIAEGVEAVQGGNRVITLLMDIAYGGTFIKYTGGVPKPSPVFDQNKANVVMRILCHRITDSNDLADLLHGWMGYQWIVFPLIRFGREEVLELLLHRAPHINHLYGSTTPDCVTAFVTSFNRAMVERILELPPPKTSDMASWKDFGEYHRRCKLYNRAVARASRGTRLIGLYEKKVQACYAANPGYGRGAIHTFSIPPPDISGEFRSALAADPPLIGVAILDLIGAPPAMRKEQQDRVAKWTAALVEAWKRREPPSRPLPPASGAGRSAPSDDPT